MLFCFVGSRCAMSSVARTKIAAPTKRKRDCATASNWDAQSRCIRASSTVKSCRRMSPCCNCACGSANRFPTTAQFCMHSQFDRPGKSRPNQQPASALHGSSMPFDMAIRIQLHGFYLCDRNAPETPKVSKHGRSIVVSHLVAFWMPPS